MVTNQYNHYVYVERPGASYEDENGDFVAEDPEWVLLSEGREQPNGRGTYIQTQDMGAYKFASVVHMPTGVPRVEEGTRIMVTEAPMTECCCKGKAPRQKADGVRIIGTCARFDSGRLHTRIWL